VSLLFQHPAQKICGRIFYFTGGFHVIHYSLQFCSPYTIESGPVEADLETAGIPVLRLETDYSQEDAGHIKTRVEAFRERIEAR
jgi:hypothetical protein